MISVVILVRFVVPLSLLVIILAEHLFEKNSDPVLKSEIIKSIPNISRSQCLHKCNRDEECKDIGTSDDGVCLLLKDTSFTINSSDENKTSKFLHNGFQRISQVPTPGNLCY